jgi:1-deoxyxylulose-5-phosphate synthase
VKAGKARYIGASSMFAWQFAKALYLADRHGWTRFVSMQNHYNLVYREEEREMLPLCREEGIGVIPWSPLARGFLTGSRKRGAQDATARESGRRLRAEAVLPGRRLRRGRSSRRGRGGPRRVPAQVALAWLLQQPGITAPDCRRDEDASPGAGGGGARVRLDADVPHGVLGH